MNPPPKAERLDILKLHNQNLPDSKWSEKHLENYFANDSLCPICIFIKKEKKFIGLAIGRLSFNNKSKLNLSTLSVSRQHRGKGHGEYLTINFFSSALRIPSMKIIYLHFRDSNKNVREFYKRFGFEKHRICGKYTDGEKKHYMEISRKSIRQHLAKTEQ